MLVIYEAVEGMTKTAKGTIRLPYDHLSAYDAFEVLAPDPNLDLFRNLQVYCSDGFYPR